MKSFHGKTFLIVDDEALLREYFVEEFRDMGAETIEAANGREALNVVRTRTVDVVLSDIRMPGGDGVSLLKEIRKVNGPKPLVFLITGFSDITSEEAEALGAEHVFKKPFDFRSIADKIADHLGF